ncbi:MAG: ribosome-associated translation inhibitor RaiA [Chthonomonadales bacterium]
MELTVKGRGQVVPNDLPAYADGKFSRLMKLFHHVESATLVYGFERGMKIIELNVSGDGVFLRSEERSSDLHAATDAAIEKLEKQLKRHKSRFKKSHRPGISREEISQRVSDELLGPSDEPHLPGILRTKRFPMKPMSAEEASGQMEAVDHDFFLFLNEESGEMNVLYRRKDGEYGLIAPER